MTPITSYIANSFSGGANETQTRRITDFQMKEPFIHESVRNMHKVAIERQSGVVRALSNDDISSDLK